MRGERGSQTRHRRLGLLLVAMLGLGAWFSTPVNASHETITIDGDPADIIDAVNRHLGSGGFHVPDPLGDILGPQCTFTNGFDLVGVYAFFDLEDPSGAASPRTDLYVAIETAGNVGDVDGDGFADVFGFPGSDPCASGDSFGIGPDEEYSLELDFDHDGRADLILIVTDNAVVDGFTGEVLPNASFAFAGRFLEIALPEIESFYRWRGLRPGRPDAHCVFGHPCCLGAIVRVGSGSDGLAEDFLHPGIELSACFDRLLSTRAAFTEINPGEVMGTQWSLFNLLSGPMGELAVTIADVQISDPSFQLSTGFRDSLNAGITHDPLTELRTFVTYAPLTAGEHRATVRVIGDDQTELVTTIFSGRARELALDWNQEDLYPEGIVNGAVDVLIPIQLADFVEADSIMIHHRSAGADTFEHRVMTQTRNDPVNDRYLGNIPAPGDACGIEFFTTIHRGEVTRRVPPLPSNQTLRVRNSGLVFPTAQPDEQYTLVSVPLRLPNNTILGTFGDELGGADPTIWRMFGHDPLKQSYVEAPSESLSSLTLGEGYWLVTRGTRLLDTSPAEGISAPLDSTFSKVLMPGANLVGGPYCFPVDTADVFARSDHPDSLEGPYRWDHGTSTYRLAKEVEPFSGYWVINIASNPVTMRIPPIPASASTAGPSEATTADANPSGWRLEIRARNGAISGPTTTIGMSAEATNGRDPLDASAPPHPPGRFVAVDVLHSEWPAFNGRYATDLRRLEGETNDSNAAWTLDVVANIAGPEQVIRLEFDGLDRLPTDLDPLLIDRRARRTIRLRTMASYAFVSSATEPARSEEACRFELRVQRARSSGTLADQLVLSQCTPNPFRRSTVIEYELPRPEHIELGVFDLAGRRVATLDEGLRLAGRHAVAWDGRSRAGPRLATGVYFYRLEAGGQSLRRKMLILD